MSCPSGFDYCDKIYVASMRKNRIHMLDWNLNILETFTNNMFNDVHSLHLLDEGLLLTSTGVDAILETDLEGKCKYAWLATENGYHKDQFDNPRIIDREKDHSEQDYPTLCQTTHVNSAIYKDDNKLLASLFHQGCVISIDKKSSQGEVIVDGLKNPHSLYELDKETYCISDTGNNRIVMFNCEGAVESINGDFSWVQDGIMTSEGNWLVADANNCRIVETTSEGEFVDEFKYNNNWKIYQVKEVLNE